MRFDNEFIEARAPVTHFQIKKEEMSIYTLRRFVLLYYYKIDNASWHQVFVCRSVKMDSIALPIGLSGFSFNIEQRLCSGFLSKYVAKMRKRSKRNLAGFSFFFYRSKNSFRVYCEQINKKKKIMEKIFNGNWNKPKWNIPQFNAKMHSMEVDSYTSRRQILRIRARVWFSSQSFAFQY